VSMADELAPGSAKQSHYQRHFDFLERKVGRIIASHKSSAAAAEFYRKQYEFLQTVKKWGLLFGAVAMIAYFGMFVLVVLWSDGPNPILSREAGGRIIGLSLFFIPLLSYVAIISFQRRVALFQALAQSALWFDDAGNVKVPSRPFVLYLRSFAAEQTYYGSTQFIPAQYTMSAHNTHSGFLVKRAVEQLSRTILVVEALNLGEYGGSYRIEGVERISLYEFDNWQHHIEQLAGAAQAIVLHYDDETSGLDFELSVASHWRWKTVVFCPEHLLEGFERELARPPTDVPERGEFANFITYQHRVITKLANSEDELPIQVGRRSKQPAVLRPWNAGEWVLWRR